MSSETRIRWLSWPMNIRINLHKRFPLHWYRRHRLLFCVIARSELHTVISASTADKISYRDFGTRVFKTFRIKNANKQGVRQALIRLDKVAGCVTCIADNDVYKRLSVKLVTVYVFWR